MRHVFARYGLAKLKSFSQKKLLLAFDFDGTLAPITNLPDRARLRKPTEGLLRRLAGSYPVAIVSGRSVDDLKERVPVGFDAYIGNHGLEGLPVEAALYLRAQKTSAQWAKKIIRLLAENKIDDVLFENKLYSLALHFRRSRQPRRREEELLKLCGRLSPVPRILPGKFVINLIPPQLPNKGDALKTLIRLEDYEAAIYIGDDDTDEDVFRLHLENLLSISVGRRRHSGADFYVKDQTEVQRLLQTLLRLRS